MLYSSASEGDIQKYILKRMPIGQDRTIISRWLDKMSDLQNEADKQNAKYDELDQINQRLKGKIVELESNVGF